ncbi:MAG: hypothetical protein ACP5UH_01735 [Candidatus Micrarchaeia archaeon]
MGHLKAQAAIIEAIASTVLMTVFVAFCSNIAYTTTQTASTLSYSNAAFDFIEMFYYNKSTSQCVTSANNTCEGTLLETFSKLYGLRYVAISGATSSHYGNSTHCNTYYAECFIEGQNYSVECIEECG